MKFSVSQATFIIRSDQTQALLKPVQKHKDFSQNLVLTFQPERPVFVETCQSSVRIVTQTTLTVTLRNFNFHATHLDYSYQRDVPIHGHAWSTYEVHL